MQHPPFTIAYYAQKQHGPHQKDISINGKGMSIWSHCDLAHPSLLDNEAIWKQWKFGLDTFLAWTRKACLCMQRMAVRFDLYSHNDEYVPSSYDCTNVVRLGRRREEAEYTIIAVLDQVILFPPLSW